MTDVEKEQFRRHMESARELGIKYGQLEGLLEALDMLQAEALRMPRGETSMALMRVSLELSKVVRHRHEKVKAEYDEKASEE